VFSAAQKSAQSPASPDPTVADWLAWGHATIAVHCCPPNGPGCGWHAILRLADLPPTLRWSDLGRRARCSHCGARGGQVMMDMDAHYERLRATGWNCVARPAPDTKKAPPAEAEGA
jgi:hypothetical protein